jgi:hypothetical protein
MGLFRRAKCAREEGCNEKIAETKMMPDLKINCPLDAVLWRSSKGDGSSHHCDCKYLIFRGLSQFFAVFDHMSDHFSVVSIWFLAGCVQMTVYLNRRAIASVKTCFRQMIFQKLTRDYVHESPRATSIRRLMKVVQRWKDLRLLPDFQAISGYFRLN